MSIFQVRVIYFCFLLLQTLILLEVLQMLPPLCLAVWLLCFHTKLSTSHSISVVTFCMEQVQFFLCFFLFFLSPRHNTIHWARVDLLEGSRGSNWKRSNRIFWHWELKSGYRSSKTHSGGTVADVTTVTGRGIWDAVKNDRELKEGWWGVTDGAATFLNEVRNSRD